MNTEKKTSNPVAFPTLTYNQTTGEPNGHEKGMTLRDYFANSAMQSIINNVVNSTGFGIPLDDIASEAYNIADYMLKQREL